MYNYTFDEFKKDIIPFAKKIKQEFNPEALIAVARGGLTLTHALSTCLDNRNAFALNSIHYDDTKKLDTIKIWNIPDLSQFKKVLIVDDIVDSGDSLNAIKNEVLKLYPHLDVRLAVIFYKQTAIIQPDYMLKHASEWVEFFWDVRLDG